MSLKMGEITAFQRRILEMGKSDQSLPGRSQHPWFQKKSAGAFQPALISWFEEEGKSYPWRETDDPYAILVSELMLQQTRIATVLEKRYFERWLERFPDCETLSEASEEDLLKAWEGLGYYNRARNLQKAARAVIEEHDGVFPRELEAILGLPGVGRYTAGAVLSFAFDQRAPIVDGNVTRVIARQFAWTGPVDDTAATRFFWGVAEEMTPESRVRAYNSAIMELGQQICTKSSPRCEECPVSESCEAEEKGLTGEIPVKKKRAKTVLKEEHVCLVIRDGQVFLTEESGSRRKGLWRLPELTKAEAADLSELFRFSYAITRYKVSLFVYSPTPLLLRK
ncbi:MAG: A/G-specific adenine glycosylase, partial [Verrucomicrobiota bacterium]